MTTRLILDCDTGTDDAVAIMAAAGHPDLELLGVCTVDGNVPLANTTDNTLRVLDHIGARIPVFAGAGRPLLRADFPIPRAVLNAGSDFQVATLDLPAATSSASERTAVDFLVDTFMQDGNTDIVLVATGPLTNIALALSVEPRLVDRIGRLVLMGGAIEGGNVSARAEFNIWVDPEAAQVVFNAGLRDVTVVPLDATHRAQVTMRGCEQLEALGTPAAAAAAALIRHRIEQGFDPQDRDGGSTPVHDAVCVAALVDPGVLRAVGRYRVDVETSPSLALGETIIDRRSWSPFAPNATVALDGDPDAFLAFLLRALGA